jgi:hypothetical protein
MGDEKYTVVTHTVKAGFQKNDRHVQEEHAYESSLRVQYRHGPPNDWITYFPRPLADDPVLTESVSQYCMRLGRKYCFLCHVRTQNWLGGATEGVTPIVDERYTVGCIPSSQSVVTEEGASV